MVMKERDEELALFLEMRRREKEKSNLLLPLNSGNHNAPSGTVLFGLFIYYFDYFWLFWAYFGNSTKMSEVALTLTRNKRWRISDIEDCVVGSETQDRCWKFLEFGEWKRQIWLWLVIFFKTSVCSKSKMLYCWFAMINFGIYFLNTDLELWSSSICLWVRRFALDWIHMNWII